MKTAVARDLAQIRAQIEDFLKSAREPALLEPGEELLPLNAENYALEIRGSRLTLQAWDRTRNWSRRLTAITEASSARLALTVERFARREGRMYLLDLARHSGAELGKRSGRLVFRERFRLLLRRQFPEWTLAEVSAKADLEHSLSPAFPRAYLKHGQHGWAAIACAPDADSSAVLSFGLIWLAYLRARERRVALEGLPVYLPRRPGAPRRPPHSLPRRPVRPLRALHLHRSRRRPARRTARLRQSRHPPRTLPPPRPQPRRSLAAYRRPPRRGAHSQTRWTHQPPRARHRVRRTLRRRPPLRTRRTPPGAPASCVRNRPPRRRARPRATCRRRSRPPALPPVSRSVAGIGGARPNRTPGGHPAMPPRLRTGARIRRRRARHPRPAGGGSRRPPHRRGVEGQRRSPQIGRAS